MATTAATTTSNLLDQPSEPAALSVYHFCVVLPRAREVYVIGDFNNWSTTATPMAQTAPATWQLALLLRAGESPGNFGYFVIAGGENAHADFSTSVFPARWAAVEERAPADSRAHAASLRARASRERRRRRPHQPKRNWKR